MKRFTIACVALSMIALAAVAADPFPGLTVEPGPVGGKAHWWRWDTMKGEDFWDTAPKSTDILANEDGTYEIAGEVPLSLALVLHPRFGRGQPWREAIGWVRQAEQYFRQSGVRVRFIIESIETWEEMPDRVESAFNAMTPRTARADMTVGLMPDYNGDPYCGIASVGRYDYYGGSIRSVTACGPLTLAHELGHNMGLRHDFKGVDYGERGYCIVGSSGSSDTCSKGTVMSYARSRVPFFSSAKFKYDELPLGDAEHNAVDWLNVVLAGRALAWELDQQRDAKEPVPHETAYD